ncbi:enoyl-CoA hydratase [Mesobacillus persicus]|uniref:Enoyl-CoA hydratase n=1 Tax=Mesobacillus persicus TaxID=930146 RepID=A0A1H8DAG1_9BACI|nr:enoyl-CoA hydratase/isomerase family protein [Mesobacillus persicus]SEN04115.1 enoyl-CoA hydratase [Mesobacillus persicus]
MSNLEPAVLLEKDENIAIVTLNRPEILNAFNVEIRDGLYETFLALRDDSTVDGVVVKAEGRGFCAGADLTEFGTESTVIRKRRIRLQHDLWDEIRRFPKPIASAIHGFAVGSGLEMSMLFDFRFASPGTKLALPEGRIGMVPAAGGTQSLPRLVHQGKALEMSLLGEQITAEEGYRLGFISKIIPKDVMIPTTVDYMKNIVQGNPQRAKWIKSLVCHGLDGSLSQGLLREKVVVARSWATR